MKNTKSLIVQNHNANGAVLSTADLGRHQIGVDFIPSAEEVARRAYFSYLNQGAQDGHDVQHWLDAEAHLYQERKLNRGHQSHNPE